MVLKNAVFGFEKKPKQDMRVYAQLPQLCLTLCTPVGCSPPGTSVHGILQARILEWVAMPSSRGSSPTQGSDPRIRPKSLGSPALAGSSLPLAHQESPSRAQNFAKEK